MKNSVLTIAETRQGLSKREFSAQELVEHFLQRISKRNPGINAFITVVEEAARAAAKATDAKIKAGEELGPLAGVPFSIKDTFCTADVRSTAAAKILDNYVAPYDATVVQKISDAGAILIGKTNCDAFGHGSSNENSDYGSVKNPFDETRVAGGSSGGAAAAIADGQCVFSIGEDTGGSIRTPAAFCGIVGLKVTYGRVSRFGCMPMASSFDTVGPMARTVADAATIMEVIAGQDNLDATTLPAPVPHYTEELKKTVVGLTIGIPSEYYENLNPEVGEKLDTVRRALEKTGAHCLNVSLPKTKYGVATYYLLVPSEDSSNLARFDGIRYGVTSEATNLYARYAESRARGFPAEVKRRIMIGTFALSHGYYDAYYKKAQQVRTKIIEDFSAVFKKVDVLLTPTAPCPAFKLNEHTADPLQIYLFDILTISANLAGLPALSVPCGSVDGLPIGAQVIGPKLGEAILLRVARAIEENFSL